MLLVRQPSPKGRGHKKYVGAFFGRQTPRENRWRCPLQRHGRSATWYRGWRSLPDGRTVRAYRPDGPRVRRGGEGRRRRLDLAPGRDPVREERS
jgi:hypothetical protein